ncbi:MAG: purine-nucleoside phosphorylase [Desulfofustis sp.]|jgi:purine-nucleoside phosphorylase|nr:purine-nucleoside phosphorylase [Desulfofustis sp.]
MVFSITAYIDEVNRAAAYLQAHLGPLPDTAIQLGTGLGAFADHIETEQVIAYRDIPGFPRATVPSHRGSLIVGTVNGRRLVVLSGRFHYYEGYSTKEVTFPIRVLQMLGLQRLIITNAAGGLDPTLKPGSIMIIRDHLNFLGENPLRGPNVEAWGPRFPDFSQAYQPRLIELALAGAESCGLKDVITTGVYVCIPGPSLETPAETRWLRNCGADAVGMSSVPEVIVAHHGGIEVLGLSAVSNVNDPDDFQPLSLGSIIEEAAAIEPKLERLVIDIITRLHPPA